MELESLFGRRAGARSEQHGLPVVVIVKKRRAMRVEGRSIAEAGGDAGLDGAGEDKRPRVFVVDRRSGDGERGANGAQPAIVGAMAVAERAPATAQVRKRRRRVDADRKPGQVTRIVFEATGPSAGTDIDGDAGTVGPQEWMPPSAYEGTIAALQAVRHTLALALGARGLRFD